MFPTTTDLNATLISSASTSSSPTSSSPTSSRSTTITTNSTTISSYTLTSSSLWSSSAEDDNWTTTTTSSFYFDASCYGTKSDDERVERSIEVFFFSSLVFVLLGLIGNVLSIVVFASKDMQQAMSSNIYLLMLASSDSLYLITVFLSHTLTTIRCWYFSPHTPLDLVNRSSFACILLQYLMDLFSDFSTCLILLFTVERVVAVFRPIKFKELFSVPRARLSCLALFLFIAATIAPYHALYIDIYHGFQVCTVRPEHEDIFAILYVVEMSLFRILPVLLIAILNVLIIHRVTRLTQAKARRRQFIVSSCSEGHGLSGAGQGLTSSSSVPSTLAAVAGGGAGGAGVRRGRRRSKAQERNIQLTFILILVSSSYVLLYIPVLVHFILQKLNLSLVLSINKSSLTIFGNYSRALYVSGFAINFFLYTVSGRVFRDQLTTLICPCLMRRKSRATPWTQTTSVPDVSSAF